MTFDKDVKFYGTYRPYQQRVLDNLEKFLDNEKIHVVAAPGSGKTILGLELIRRLDKPSLVLAPSIAIREQWIERFTNGFLNDKKEKDKWISNDLKVKKPIICITYQALYSAFKKEINKESDEEYIQEEQDYSSFELLKTLKEYGIKTICLDECHHLKSEWWKALETIVKKMEGSSLISLTATPPYDASYTEWQRYISLCGPIDEEIFVPELISDNNLCPHQDYVYYSYPTVQEETKILKFYSNGIKIFHKYKNHPQIIDIVKSNDIYLDFNRFKKVFYKNEDYYTALVLFLLENDIKVSSKIKHLVNKEKFDIKHLEIILQNILFDDTNSYIKHPLILSIKKEFSALGVVHSRNINLVHDERINKVLSMSLSKLESIKTIVKTELNALKDNLKCVILTDYIKLKSKVFINSEKEIDCFGTIPIFEYLRRSEIENINLCCISGSICIVPENCLVFINEEFEYERINNTDYFEIKINASNRKKVVALITTLLNKGYFNVLVGTKALLGEGWDSPCINTLIMASFIGSYVLSNQMRGRAIRTDINNPNKIANVWHLVCLNPFDYKYSSDYQNLEKRFSTFVGISNDLRVIENGITRLGQQRVPYTSIEKDIANNKTLKECVDRNKTKEIWNESITKAKRIDVLTKVTTMSRKRLKKEYSFYSAALIFILSYLVILSSNGLYGGLLNTFNNEKLAFIISSIIVLMIQVIMLKYLFIMIRLANPEMKLKTFSKATLRALKKIKIITNKNVKVKVKRVTLTTTSVYLLNATTYEQNVFSECINQIFDEMKQPRYIIAKPKKLIRFEYYVVPDVFKKNKDTAQIFTKEIIKKIGGFITIFAKSEEGKNESLKAKKIQHVKFKKFNISTKNILLKNKK